MTDAEAIAHAQARLGPWCRVDRDLGSAVCYDDQTGLWWLDALGAVAAFGCWLETQSQAHASMWARAVRSSIEIDLHRIASCGLASELPIVQAMVTKHLADELRQAAARVAAVERSGE